MKSTLKKSLFLALLAASTSVSAQAGTLNFGDTGNGVDASSTTWDAGTTADWNNGTSTVGWTDNSDAVFGGTAGTVMVAPGNRIANSLTFNSNGYILNSTSANNGGIAINQGGTITVASGDTATINSYFYTIGVGGTSSSAPVNLTKAGSGTLVLAGVGINGTTPTGTHGDNRPAGQIDVTGGALQLGNGTGWGGYFDNSSFTLSNGSTVIFDYNNNGGNSPNPLVNVRGTGNVTFEGYRDGYFSEGGSFLLTNTGTTTIALDTSGQVPDGAYYFGSVFLQGGGNALSSTSVLNMVSGNVIVRQAQTVAGVTGNGGYITEDQGAQTFTINTAAGVTTSSGTGIGATNLGGNNGMNLAVTGTGKQVLTGVLTYTGTTSITGGSALQLGSTADTTSSAINGFNSAVTIGSGSTLILDGGAVNSSLGGGVSLTGAGNLQVGTGSTSFANAYVGLNEASNNITGTTTIDLKDGGTWPGSQVFIGAHSLSSTSLLNMVSGSLDLRSSTAVAGITGTDSGAQIASDKGIPTAVETVTDNVSTGSDSYAGALIDLAPGSALGGAGQSQVAFTKTGTGTQVLTGNVGYTGATAINAGTLQLGSTADTTSSAINSFNSAVTIASGATLLLDGGSANSTLGNNTSLTGAGNLQIGSGTSSFAGAYTGLNEASNTITGTTTINMTGTTAWPSGVVFIDNANSLSATSLLNIVSGSLDFRSSSTVAGITSTNSSALIASDAFAGYRPVLTDDVETGAQNYAGTMADAIPNSLTYGGEQFAFTKTGAGTQVLSGTETYSGATTVTAGKLKITGNDSATGATSVGGGATLQVSGHGAITQSAINVTGTSATSVATLKGDGTIGATSGTSAASVTVGQFGVLAVGDATDTVNANNLTLASTGPVNMTNGSTLSFVLNGSNTDGVSGVTSNNASVLDFGTGDTAGTVGLTLTGTVNLQLVLNYTPVVGDMFQLTNFNESGTTGTFGEINGVVTNLSEGSTFTTDGEEFTITYQGGLLASDIVLTADGTAVVPEPSDFAMMLAGFAVLAWKLRRSRLNKSAV